jgi:hypothetical protein
MLKVRKVRVNCTAFWLTFALYNMPRVWEQL